MFVHRSAESTEAGREKDGDAASAAARLSQGLSQAQAFGRATVQELFGQRDGEDPANSSGNEEKTKDKNTESSSKSSKSSKSSDTPPSSAWVNRLRGFAAEAVKEMKLAVLPEAPKSSALKGASAKAAAIQTSDVSAITLAPTPEESGWQKQWKSMREALGGHAFFRKLSDNKILNAGRDVADSIREKWETSDSPLVHRLQDATDSLFTEGEAAAALREIRSRDSSFDMVEFLGHLRNDVPVLLRAYLTGDEEVIKEHCSPEMIERLTGIMKAQTAAGLVPDPTLLDISEVELVDVKVVDDDPIIVTQFTCQQINCTRDLHGNVVEGAPDEVHRVYYYWALQQEAQGYVGNDGNHHPPRWQLREMMIRGMHHLL